MEWDAVVVVLGCTWEPHKQKQCVVGVLTSDDDAGWLDSLAICV